MSGKEIIKKPRESFIGKGTTATEIVLDGAACLAPILGLPAMGFRIINQIIEERNFKAFAEAFKQTQNAVFDFNSLNQEEKALFLINVSDIFNSVSETIRVQKIKRYANLLANGIQTETIFSDDDAFHDYKSILDELSESTIELLFRMDEKTEVIDGVEEPHHFIKATDEGISFDEENQYCIQKAISLGLVTDERNVENEKEGTIDIGQIVYYLSPLYYRFKKYIIRETNSAEK